LEELKAVVYDWADVGPIVGFLDPMRYVCDSTAGPYTRSVDQRLWLSIMKSKDPFLAVQFTGNSNSTSFALEQSDLRADLAAADVPHWVEFKRQHYMVSVGSSDASILADVHERTLASWRAWCGYAPEIKDRYLAVSKG
jgi:hypothetical protein